ncbi:unnamed protein product [Rotaria socialis]|uniref:Peptidase metallopeptidase domain-containing protein n=1 Tax=Rotaria socialis TaxID=392032 RepID=A0A817UEH4_9BILA|nr:unnamed protein product [Rotaria socialis]CAF4718136.1 unnamed protein product [Rotaria socialis]
MKRSRCGNPDIGSFGNTMQVERLQSAPLTQGRSMKENNPVSYVTQENVWTKKNLKWFIAEYPKQQKQLKSKDQLRRILFQAFNDWEKYSGLKFEMTSAKETADLKVRFVSKDHDDGYAFDGPGKTLAHAFFPKSGDIHFDDDEMFSDDYTDQDEQYTLRLVAAHEIGHALGLGHSFEENSLMFPVYQQYSADYNISDDDQQGIQKLYGKPNDRPIIESTTTKTASSSSPSIKATTSSNGLPLNNWCSGDFQTGCEGPDGELYLFKDNHAWRYRGRAKHVWDRQPKLISEHFRSLTDTTITACVKSVTGYTYLFRDHDMWKVRTLWSIEGPHQINGKNYPQNPHIALFHNNSIYLIKNNFAYYFNELNHHRDLPQYPIRKLFDSPPKESIHSGFTYNKRHYIFTRNHVYVYDSTYGKTISGYPKQISNGWFACDTTAQAQKWSKKTTRGYSRNGSRNKYNHREHDYHHHDEDYRHGQKRPHRIFRQEHDHKRHQYQ